MTKKKILVINRKAPYGNSLARESLDAVLAASAYEQELSLLFMDDAVFQLKKGQETTAIGQKNLAATLPVLPMYDVDKLYAEQAALDARGLSADDLVLPVEMLNTAEITKLMEEQDTLLSF